jgi:phosphate:Na+ symporter
VFVNKITPGNVFAGENIARHIANAHTFFNVLNTIVFLPFAGLLARIAEKLIPKGAGENLGMGEPKHLGYHLVNDSELAIGQALKEMREMLRLVRMSLSISYEAFKEKNYRKQSRVAKIENAMTTPERDHPLSGDRQSAHQCGQHNPKDSRSAAYRQRYRKTG